MLFLRSKNRQINRQYLPLFQFVETSTSKRCAEYLSKGLFSGSAVLVIIAFLCSIAWGGVIINEIYYNPVDHEFEAGSLREFLELHNPGSEAVDLSGYFFSEGIDYHFPDNTVLDVGAYLVLARVPSHKTWINRPFRVYGPFEGRLSDRGDELVLLRPDQTEVDRIDYSDSFPWPRGADGYGKSLERIDAAVPSDDFHSWRSSLVDEGTPGRTNSVAGTPGYPVIRHVETDPLHPTSEESVLVRVYLDVDEEAASVILRWEPAGERTAVAVLPMRQNDERSKENVLAYEASIPPNPSETLIRFNVHVRLDDGTTLRLPHAGEPRPFESYFIYDGEIDTVLPVLWVLEPVVSNLPSRPDEFSGVVALLPDTEEPLVYDGAFVFSSRNGEKVRFLKGEEFRGDRTLNLIPEIPNPHTTAGVSAPFRERLGFWFFKEMGVLSPRAEFFRIVRLPASPRDVQTQQLIVQQVNERFLEMNGRDPDGDLYKLERFDPNWEKHTNKEDGTRSIQRLLSDLNMGDPVKRREAIERHLVVDEFLAFSAASVLTSNWDGFWQNNWMYLDPGPRFRWEIMPWDLDWLWGSTSTGVIYAEMPTDFPIDGKAVGASQASRPPGQVTAVLHRDREFHEAYLRLLRIELTRNFTEEKLFGEIHRMQDLLIRDLARYREQSGEDRSLRRSQIRQSYSSIKTFIQRRREYLDKVLPADVSVADWEIY